MIELELAQEGEGDGGGARAVGLAPKGDDTREQLVEHEALEGEVGRARADEGEHDERHEVVRTQLAASLARCRDERRAHAREAAQLARDGAEIGKRRELVDGLGVPEAAAGGEALSARAEIWGDMRRFGEESQRELSARAERAASGRIGAEGSASRGLASCRARRVGCAVASAHPRGLDDGGGGCVAVGHERLEEPEDLMKGHGR